MDALTRHLIAEDRIDSLLMAALRAGRRAEAAHLVHLYVASRGETVEAAEPDAAVAAYLARRGLAADADAACAVATATAAADGQRREAP